MSPHKNGPQALLSSAPRPRYRTQQQALPRRLKNRRRGKVPAVSPHKNGLRGLPFHRPATAVPDAATSPRTTRGHGLRLSPRHVPPAPSYPSPRRRTAIKFRLRSSAAPHDSPPPPSPLRLDVPLFRRHKKTGPRGSVRSVCLPQSGITPTRWWRAVSRRCRRLRG